MDFDWTTLTENLGWREVLIAVIGLLAVYVFFVFLRLIFLKPKRRIEPGAGEGFDEEGHEDIAAADEEPPLTYTIKPTINPSPAGNADGVRPDPATRRFVEHRHLDAVEHDLADLRDELKSLRTEVRLLRTDLQQQVDRLKAAQNTSPLYSDAMQMALLGHDAETIANRCSIAVAEAELVVALANSRVE